MREECTAVAATWAGCVEPTPVETVRRFLSVADGPSSRRGFDLALSWVQCDRVDGRAHRPFGWVRIGCLGRETSPKARGCDQGFVDPAEVCAFTENKP